MKGRGSSPVSPFASWQITSATSKESSQGLEERFSIRDDASMVVLVGRARAAVAVAKARRISGEVYMFEGQKFGES